MEGRKTPQHNTTTSQHNPFNTTETNSNPYVPIKKSYRPIFYNNSEQVMSYRIINYKSTISSLKGTCFRPVRDAGQWD